MTFDPCQILGVDRDAGPAEWKRAYRRLAMRWHPDRCDHPDATERFKEINAAYEALLTVDPVSDEETDESAASEAAAATPKAADIRQSLQLDLEEAASGCRPTVHFFRSIACTTCGGSGEHGVARTRFCKACHGSGRVHDAQRRLIPCSECAGRGLFTERHCPDCQGQGRQRVAVSLEVNVPPGMLPGNELRLAGQGEAGDAAQQAGDLYLTIVFREHELFELRGRDLHYRMPVSVLALLAGAEIELPGLFGLLTHRLTAGSQAVSEICLAGQGYPGRGGAAAGDLRVEIVPVYPENLEAGHLKRLQQAHQDLMQDVETTLPEIARWWAARRSTE